MEPAPVREVPMHQSNVAVAPAVVAPSGSVARYLAGFVLLGLTLSFSGPALEHLRSRAHVGIGASGLLLGGQAVGYIVASFLVGRLYDRGHGHRIWAVACLVVAATVVIVSLVSSLAVLVALFAVIGACGGMMDVGGNTLVVWSRPPETVGSALNALHLCFGIGALASPLLVSQSIVHGGDLRWFAGLLALVALGLAATLARGEDPPHRAQPTVLDEGGEVVHRRPPLRGGLGLVCLFFVLYVGLETGFAGWVHTWAQEVHLGGVSTAGLLTSCFWVGFTGGRLAAIWLTRRISSSTMLLVSCVLATSAAGTLAIAGPHGAVVWVSTAVFGITVGPQFPTMIAHADQALHLSAVATSYIITSSGIGGLVIPLGIGWLFDRAGARAMPWTVAIAGVATTVVTVAIVATVRQRPPVTSMKAPVT